MRLLLVARLLVAFALAGFVHAADAAVLITVDKASQRLTVNVDGELRWNWPVSTGRTAYDTPNGDYTVFRVAKDHYSKEWDDAPMPYSIFFTRAGHAIHGTLQTRQLGRPASHGCVRLAPKNAAQLFALVRAQGLSNTKVVIAGELPPKVPAVADRAPAAVPTPRARVARSTPMLPDDESVIHTVRERPRERAVRTHAAAPQRDDRPRKPVARVYASPQRGIVPPIYERPPTVVRQRLPASPGVYYDTRVEVVEETKINGTWVRRRYYRQAMPQDFRGWR
jgi:hypothetical protein